MTEYDKDIVASIVNAPSVMCQPCGGKGQTKECATIVKQVKPKVWETTQLGSGCLVCLGTGIKGRRRVFPGLKGTAA